MFKWKQQVSSSDTSSNSETTIDDLLETTKLLQIPVEKLKKTTFDDIQQDLQQIKTKLERKKRKTRSSSKSSYDKSLRNDFLQISGNSKWGISIGEKAKY